MPFVISECKVGRVDGESKKSFGFGNQFQNYLMRMRLAEETL